MFDVELLNFGRRFVGYSSFVISYMADDHTPATWTFTVQPSRKIQKVIHNPPPYFSRLAPQAVSLHFRYTRFAIGYCP